MIRRLLCGLPIDLTFEGEIVEAFARLSPPSDPNDGVPRLSLAFAERTTLPQAQGELLYRSTDFEVRAREPTAGRDLELSVLDAGQAIAWARLSADQQSEIVLLPKLSPAQVSLRDELLPELIVAHLWPLCGVAYLHASGTARPDGARLAARLFVGPSGRGKTTTAELFAARGETLFCTDRCAVQGPLDGSAGWAAAAPWHGGAPDAGARVALSEIFILSREGQRRRQRLAPSAAFAALTANAFLPRWWPLGLGRALDALARLAAATPVFELRAEPDDGLVQLVVQQSQEAA